MSRYLFLLFSLFMPVKISPLSSHRYFYHYPSQLVAMVPPPPGDLPSKALNSAATPSQGCRSSSSTTYKKDGSSIVTTTITCTKQEKQDKEGKTVKKSDTSSPKYSVAQKNFFGDSSKGSSSSKK